MSPEQFDAEPGRVDERSDVYAIGVMAYEVLTGRLPHDLAGVRVAAAARFVTESTPPRRGDLDPTLRGDLETIVGKALAKDHAQRYASARELGEDLRRYLRQEPVRAVPPSRLYYLRRFARRNPALTTTLVLAALLLIAGTAISTWQARRAEDARGRADVLRVLADGETRKARESAKRAALAAARIAAEHHDYATSRRLLESVEPGERGWVWSWLGSGGNGSFLWDTSGAPPSAIYPQSPTGFAFSSDGARLVSSYSHPRDGPGWFGTVDVATAKARGSAFNVVANDTLGVALGLDGLAAVGSRDKRAYLVDPEERRITATLAGDAGPVQGGAFDGPGARVATGSTHGTARVWDTHDPS